MESVFVRSKNHARKINIIHKDFCIIPSFHAQFFVPKCRNTHPFPQPPILSYWCKLKAFLTLPKFISKNWIYFCFSHLLAHTIPTILLYVMLQTLILCLSFMWGTHHVTFSVCPLHTLSQEPYIMWS